jgi:hypothetical protein
MSANTGIKSSKNQR